jgi:hypothetical protein
MRRTASRVLAQTAKAGHIRVKVAFRERAPGAEHGRSFQGATFTKNRERLQEGDVFQQFMTALLNHAQVKPLLSDEHFSVDGTLIEAGASFKSFKPKDGSDDSDGSSFHKQKRGNDPAPPIRTAVCIAKPKGAKPSCATWGRR